MNASHIQFVASTVARSTLACSLVFTMALAGCGSNPEDNTSASTGEATESPSAESTSAPEENVSLSGKVIFEGPAPERFVIEYNDECREFHKDAPLLSDATIVDENGGVQFAVVYIADPPEGDYPIPAEMKTINQLGCRYEPHVIAYRAGQVLEVINSDPFTHNVRSFAKENRRFNMGQPANTPARKKTYEKPEMEVKLKCDVHPWMKGFMFVMDHPYFAVTNADGTFQLPEIPAGDYTLIAWHEKFGQQKIPITINEQQEDLKITYTAQ